MTGALALTVLVAAMTVTGCGAAAMFRVAFRTRTGALSTAFLAGTGLTAFALLLARAAGLGVDVATVLGLAAAGAIAAAAAGLRVGYRSPGIFRALLLLAVAAVPAGTMLVAFSAPDRSHDGVLLFLERARLFFLNAGIPDPAPAPVLGVPLPEYPPLVPLTEALLFSLAGGVDLVAVRGLHVVFFAALAGVFIELAGAGVPALLGALALVSCPLVHETAPRAYADIPLLAMLMAAALLLRRASAQDDGAGPSQDPPRGRAGPAILAGILLGATGLTKKEGYAFVVVLLGAAAISGGRRKSLVTAGSVAVVMIGAWLAVVAAKGWRNDNFLLLPGVLGYPWLILERAGAVTRRVAESLIDPGEAMLLAAALVVLAILRPALRSTAGFLALSGAGVLAATAGAWLVTSHPMSVYLDTTFDRVIVHAMALVLAAATVAAGDRGGVKSPDSRAAERRAS